MYNCLAHACVCLGPPKQEDLPPALLEQLAAASVVGNGRCLSRMLGSMLSLQETEKLKKAAEAKNREIEVARDLR